MGEKVSSIFERAINVLARREDLPDNRQVTYYAAIVFACCFSSHFWLKKALKYLPTSIGCLNSLTFGKGMVSEI